jgi:cell division initiation protein
MKLTPLDIRHKEFARAMRGYKDLEVDEFLDDIADEFERLFNENIDHKERLESLEEKNEQYKNIEETLKKTLVSAQQQAEELKQNAKKEADLILRDAELKARSILNDSYAERQKIQRSVQALKQKQEDLKYQMRSLLDSYTNLLDQDGELAGGELYEGAEAGAARAPQSTPYHVPQVSRVTPGVEAALAAGLMGDGSELPLPGSPRNRARPPAAKPANCRGPPRNRRLPRNRLPPRSRRLSMRRRLPNRRRPALPPSAMTMILLPMSRATPMTADSNGERNRRAGVRLNRS